MCSALYLNVFEVTRQVMRLAADKLALQTRYPIYFVVKYRQPMACVISLSPGAHETYPHKRVCFQIEASPLDAGGANLGAVNEDWWS